MQAAVWHQASFWFKSCPAQIHLQGQLLPRQITGDKQQQQQQHDQ
jgi:hypothetical protein